MGGYGNQKPRRFVPPEVELRRRGSTFSSRRELVRVGVVQSLDHSLKKIWDIEKIDPMPDCVNTRDAYDLVALIATGLVDESLSQPLERVT